MIKVNRLTPKAGTAAGPLAAAAAAATAAPAQPAAVAPVHTPAPTQAVIPTTPVLKPEEALQQVSTLKLSLPEELFSSSLTAIPAQEITSSAPFIGFASSQSPSWASHQAAGLADGEMYLQSSAGITPLNECKFWLIDTFYCFTNINNKSEILEAKSQLTDAEVKADIHQEHYVCPIIFDAGDELLPAKLEMRGARSAAVKQAINAVQTAATPEFASSSDAARVAAAFPAPWGRQTIWMRASRRPSRTKGRMYVSTSSVIRPTTLTDMERIANATNDDAFTSVLSEVRAAVNKRIEEMNNKAV